MTSVIPPTVNHGSRNVSSADALCIVQCYLENASNDPSLDPSALLTDHGPQSSVGGSAGGLRLHNLRRVEAGLRGERWTAELGLDGLRESDDTNTGANVTLLKVDGGIVTEGAEGEGWQDMDSYQREQEDETGEVGPRDTGLEDGGEVPAVQQSGAAQDDEYRKKRKQEKKDRKKKENKDREEKRKREKEAEV